MSHDGSGNFFTWLSGVCFTVSAIISFLNNYTGVLAFFKDLDKTKVKKYCALSIIIFACLFVFSAIINSCQDNSGSDDPVPQPTDAPTEVTAETTPPSTESVAQPLYQVGDIVLFGRYEQDNDLNNGPDPIRWKILDRQDNDLLLLSCDILDSQPYSEQLRDTVWKISDVRDWLNMFFYRTAFSYEDQSMILPVEPPSYGNYFEDDNYTAQIFLLDKNEVIQYLPMVQDRKCTPSAWAASDCNVQTDADSGSSPWMLREAMGGMTEDRPAPAWSTFYKEQDGQQYVYFMFSGFMPQYYTDFQCLTYVDTDGSICVDESAVNAEHIGIRPAMWVRCE